MANFYNRNIRINYLDKGGGRPIIMLHGALASHRVWTRQFEAFSNRYRMIAIDFRGHGNSDKPKHGYDPVNLVKDIELLMSHLGLAKTLIIGSSMGGVIAQLFYFSRPAAVEALILVGTLAKAVWLGRRAEYLSELVSKSPEDVARTWFVPESHDEHISLVVEEARKASLDFHRNVVNEFGDFDLRPRLGEIKVPTLIVVGNDDSVTPVEESSQLRLSRSLIQPPCESGTISLARGPRLWM